MICYAANCPKELRCIHKEANGTSFLGFQDTSIIGHPTCDTFKRMVSSGCLKNCILKTKDFSTAQVMFGPNCAWLRGRKSRQRPKVVDSEYTQIPRDSCELHKCVTLVGDVMIVNSFGVIELQTQGTYFQESSTWEGTVRIVNSFFPPHSISSSATQQIARKLELWHSPPSSHDHGRVGSLIGSIGKAAGYLWTIYSTTCLNI